MKTVHPVNSHIGECNACETSQKLAQPKQIARLIVETATKKYLLRAYDETLHAITEMEKEISAQDLLYAPQFSCTCNKFNVIKNISRP